MLSCCRAAPAPAIPGRDARPAFAIGGDEQAKQTAALSEEALDAFDRLRVREVKAEVDDTASTFLARFRSTATSLGPEESIKLVVYALDKSLELLAAVLFDPQASKICSLVWGYRGEEDVNSVVPLLINSCPELGSLEVHLKCGFVLDFVSSVLEHPSNKLKVVELPRYIKGSIQRFFAALGQSQVLALTLSGFYSTELYQGLRAYLAKDLLVRLKLRMEHTPIPPGRMMLLADCTRLAEIKWDGCQFFQPTALAHFPKSVTNLVFFNCRFAGGFDWSFLIGSNVQELGFLLVRDVEGNQLGSALAVHLRAKGLDKLHVSDCYFINQTLAAVGAEIGRIKRLEVENGYMGNASIELIALALQSPNNEMKELSLPYYDDTMGGIEDHLLPALRHPNCHLAELKILAHLGHEAAALRVENRFCRCRALFVLLQGQKVKRLRSSLRRLPVEMFRMVGEVLM